MVNSWAGLCTWLTRRPRPCGSGGSTGDPAKKTRAGHQGTKESAGGAQGRWRREGAEQRVFNFHESESAFTKVKCFHEGESAFNLVLTAVFL